MHVGGHYVIQGTDFSTNQKRVYDFLLVNNTNYIFTPHLQVIL